MSSRHVSRRRFVTWSLAASLALCAGVGPLRAAESATAVDVIATLQPFVARQVLAGAVTLVADKEGIVSHQAIGMADIAAKKPMTLDALFWVASTSKMFTGAAVMMLVDEGKVDLAAPVATYLPEFAGLMVAVKQGGQTTLVKPGHAVTVRELLNHTSGLPFLLPAEQGKIDVFTVADTVAQSAKLTLAFEPGSAYQYSNCGINAAGRIIEVVSGTSYEQFLQQRLFAPRA